MDILKAVKERRSIRSFKKKEIPQDVIDTLIEALIWAPSAGNLQARKFYFIREQKLKEALVSAALGQGFIAEAPLVIAACTDAMIFGRYGDRGVNLYAIQDVAASIMGMMLVAHEHRLGSVWVGAFREANVIEALDLPENLRPVALVPVGYPSRIPSPPQRVSPQEAVEFR